MIKKIVLFFDKLEDRVRGKLSHYPILYAFLGGVGMILFWRGVWHIADTFNMSATSSIIIGSVILLMTGLLVYGFIGNRLMVSDLAGEKKLTKKTESEVETEEVQIKNLQETLDRVEDKISHLKE